MFSCMPLLSPLLINNSNNTKESLNIILPFSLGRVFSYTIIAMIAYISSMSLKQILNNNELSSMILGISTISIGVYLFLKTFKTNISCNSHATLVKKLTLNKLGFFTIGATMSINPCAPIMALVGVAVNSNSIYESIALGLFFGFGAVLFSILFYGFILSTLIRGLLREFSSYKKLVEQIAAILLIIVGILVLNGAIAL